MPVPGYLPIVHNHPLPQMDRLVEQMNQMIKDLLGKTEGAFPTIQDKYLDPLLFTLRKTPKASTGVTPFELDFGWCPRDLMQVPAGP